MVMLGPCRSNTYDSRLAAILLANPLSAVFQKGILWIEPPDDIMSDGIVNRPHQ
jgi:hypothetical protein